MTIQDQIAALLSEAEPLRLLDDIEAERQGLGRIVDQINGLRAQEAAEKHDAFIAEVKAALVVDSAPEAIALRAEIAAQPEPMPARRPGRPRKAEAN